MRRAWLLLALLPLALGDCARGGDENVITFWHAMGRWEPQLLEIVDAYNALHPEMPVRAYNMSRYQALSQKIIAAATNLKVGSRPRSARPTRRGRPR